MITSEKHIELITIDVSRMLNFNIVEAQKYLIMIKDIINIRLAQSMGLDGIDTTNLQIYM